VLLVIINLAVLALNAALRRTTEQGTVG